MLFDAPGGGRSGSRLLGDERVNFRNGYRPPGEWDTRAGTTDLAIPKRRSGLYFPVPQPALDSGHYTFVWIDA
ncbi:hypothetical protein GCM10023176_24590 [Micromonospora coerulea]|uniref:Uncharacterized protein n=1 Tax=Micromonospora coerulea TaxID=47856 RepID=A0ABP8SGR0_9ACTN